MFGMSRAFPNGRTQIKGRTMKKVSIALVTVLAFAACSRSSDKASVDSALSVGSTTATLDSITAAEQVQPGVNTLAPTTSGTAPRRTSTSSGTTTRRSSGSTSSGSSGSSGTTSTASTSSGTTTTVKHTQRDAAIGAAAGAIIGATTSHNKVGGAVVGGVVGGVLGGVIGNNVDVKKKKN
jgi:hypothetical protein